jgi:hypothetical protein
MSKTWKNVKIENKREAVITPSKSIIVLLCKIYLIEFCVSSNLRIILFNYLQAEPSTKKRSRSLKKPYNGSLNKLDTTASIEIHNKHLPAACMVHYKFSTSNKMASIQSNISMEKVWKLRQEVIGKKLTSGAFSRCIASTAAFKLL